MKKTQKTQKNTKNCKKAKKILVLGIMFIFAFAIWTVLVQTADVKPVGINGTDIGFSKINTKFFELTGVHMNLYTLTDWLGVVPLLVCIAFGITGCCQLIKRKNLLKVDCDIILLGVYYTFVIAGYLLFETVCINYRPILIDGRMEKSYPSSTTLLVLSVMPTLAFEVKRRLKNKAFAKIIVYITAAFSAFTVIARLLSGVHWLTDILGGVLLSCGMFYIYKGCVLMFDSCKK